VYQQWFPNGDASSFAAFMFEAFDENRVSLAHWTDIVVSKNVQICFQFHPECHWMA